MNAVGATATMLMVGLLAGCGNGGSGDDLSAFERLDRRAEALDERALAADRTLQSDIPVTGGTSYDGVIRLEDVDFNSAPANVSGNLQLNADFDDDVISGSAGNFITEASQRVTGTLVLDSFGIDRSQDPNDDRYDFAADLRGDLTDRLGSTVTVDRILAGDFYGPGVEYVFGDVSV
jgi:hypothetical protein